jgi:integrase/recombinase XerD
MFETLFNYASAVREHQRAPLAAERGEFLLYLHRRGVCRNSLRGFAALLRQIVRFLKLEKLRSVKESEIEDAAREWFRHRRTAQGRPAGPCSEPHFKWFAKRWLRFHGSFIPAPIPRRPFALELGAFEEFMKSSRCYSQSTMAGRICQTAIFLKWYSQRRRSFGNIRLADVDEYFAGKPQHWTKWSLASCAAALRAFFRYAEARSLCQAGIANGIKSPPIRPDYFTPTGPKWAEVSRLLASTNGPNLAEVRAKAILVLVSIYGLRRSEIVRLMLCDFDWTNQVFTVRRAKHGRVQQFPIGPDAKEALLHYTLYARPQCSCQNLFVTLRSPHAPMNPTSVSIVVSRRMKRWRIRTTKNGPHSLRHACATRLLQQGASLQEIADFLGHRNSKCVGVYAKFDMHALCEVSILDHCGEL